MCVREYLEIIPRVAGGVLIHAHDIFLPADYPREAVLHNLAFWSEQYLLQALLMFNPQFEVLWGSSYMQSRATTALENAFPHWQQSYRNMPPKKRRFLPTPRRRPRLALQFLDAKAGLSRWSLAPRDGGMRWLSWPAARITKFPCRLR